MRDMSIVRAITELAHALDIETTAEGVEETAQLMELRAHGCSSVQGFLFSEPMSLKDVEKLFREDGGVLQNVACHGMTTLPPSQIALKVFSPCDGSSTVIDRP